MKYVWTLGVLVICVFTGFAQSPVNDTRLYAIGNPTLTDIWVDPINGNDNNNGATRSLALKTVQAAWNRTPRGATFTTTGYRILLTPGTYTSAHFPGYVEWRWGTAQFPTIIQAADGRNTVTITTSLDVYDCRYLYLIDVNFTPDPPSFAVHFGHSDHILLRGGKFDGRNVAGQTVKINNSQYVYVEQCDIGYATGTTLDFVATRYGQVIGNRIHDGGNWAMFAKGGSAYFLIEGNELFNAARGGFSAGQFTGFEYLDAPWVHYEAYDIKFVNNLIHDTTGCGLAVQSGYNILLAHNTLYRTGVENALIEMLHGNRLCSGDTVACTQQQARGGWGTASTSDIHNLPSRNVFIYNNLIYNPAGVQSRWMHMLVRGPQTPLAGSNIPSPATLDQNLQIRGNLIWNGPANHPLGIESGSQGCQPTNPTCNATQLRAENTINTVEPQLTNAASGDYSPRTGSNVLTATTYAIPDFTWVDAPATPSAPAGTLSNAVTRDANNVVRTAISSPGAFLPSGVPGSGENGGLQFYPLSSPVRLLDTRAGMSPNACSQPNAAIPGGNSRTQSARGFCGIPASAQAITGNVTTVQSGGGFLTLYPSDAAQQPFVANTNFSPNQIINNVFTVKLANSGPNAGSFNIFALTTTEVVIDVTGYYAPPGAGGLYFHPLPAPIRLLETRLNRSGFTTPGMPLVGNTDTAQVGRNLTYNGVTIPAAAQALVGNATTVSPGTAGYLTLYPQGTTRPFIASSNFNMGDTMNGPFTVGLGVTGQFMLYVASTTHLVIDVVGYYSTEATDVNGVGLLFFPLPSPVRLLETRAGELSGCERPGMALLAGSTRTQAARNTCTIPSTAQGIIGNATTVSPGTAGYVTFFPSSVASPPLVATSNFQAGQVFNRHFMVGLGSGDGAFNIYVSPTTDMVVDVSGYFAP